jgi:hypothetical protein
MTYVVAVREPTFAPCGFLVCKADAQGNHDPYGSDTILIQSDWDFAGVASNWGWKPCQCDHSSTDGTVPCEGCGKSVGDMLADAFDFLVEHGDEPITDPGYFLED